jgi:hypothetical protein
MYKKIDDKTLEETITVVKNHKIEDLQFQKEDIEAEIATLQKKLKEINDLIKQF